MKIQRRLTEEGVSLLYYCRAYSGSTLSGLRHTMKTKPKNQLNKITIN